LARLGCTPAPRSLRCRWGGVRGGAAAAADGGMCSAAGGGGGGGGAALWGREAGRQGRLRMEIRVAARVSLHGDGANGVMVAPVVWSSAAKPVHVPRDSCMDGTQGMRKGRPPAHLYQVGRGRLRGGQQRHRRRRSRACRRGQPLGDRVRPLPVGAGPLLKRKGMAEFGCCCPLQLGCKSDPRMTSKQHTSNASHAMAGAHACTHLSSGQAAGGPAAWCAAQGGCGLQSGYCCVL
jgi:hypothetical protein